MISAAQQGLQYQVRLRVLEKIPGSAQPSGGPARRPPVQVDRGVVRRPAVLDIRGLADLGDGR